MIKNKKLILLLFILIFVLISCTGFKRPAIGGNYTIVVLADEVIWNTYKPQLKSIFSDPIFTPAEEYRFNLKRITLDEFKEGSSKFKNLILLSNIDSNNEETVFIKKFFSEKVIDGVRKGDYYYAEKDDIWAKGQKVLFLLDSKNIFLSGYLDQFSDKLFSIFNEKMLKDVKSRLFDRFNNKKAQEYAKKNYNIDIFVPHDFIVVNEGKEKDRFIRFRRFNPDRWLTVLRTEYDNNLSFQENIITVRDRIGTQFGDSVKVNPEFLTFEEDSTFTDTGLKAEGIWEYAEGGGPFFTHGFIRNGTFYIIDGAVFAPSEDKYPYIIQLELMAETVKFQELEN